MKRFILSVFLVLCLSGLAFADASFEIIGQDIDNNGNIRVWTCHKVDGVEVVSQYPKMKDAKGVEHYVYCTRYSKPNFKDCKDTKEIETKIINDIANYSDNLIRKEYDAKAAKTINQTQIDYATAVNSAFVADSLKDLVGKTKAVTTAVVKVDTDLDGVNDKEITLTTSGTKTEKAI
jgi:hypothetical protein